MNIKIRLDRRVNWVRSLVVTPLQKSWSHTRTQPFILSDLRLNSPHWAVTFPLTQPRMISDSLYRDEDTGHRSEQFLPRILNRRNHFDTTMFQPFQHQSLQLVNLTLLLLLLSLFEPFSKGSASWSIWHYFLIEEIDPFKFLFLPRLCFKDFIRFQYLSV